MTKANYEGFDYFGRSVENDNPMIRKGVTDAFDFWLSQHEVSFPNLLEDVIQRVFQQWLNEHEDDILIMITKQLSNNESMGVK